MKKLSALLDLLIPARVDLRRLRMVLDEAERDTERATRNLCEEIQGLEEEAEHWRRKAEALVYGPQPGESESAFADRMREDLDAIRSTDGAKALLYLLYREEEEVFAAWLDATPADAAELRMSAIASRRMRAGLVKALSAAKVRESAVGRAAANKAGEYERFLRAAKKPT